jgi:hypothetical protein
MVVVTIDERHPHGRAFQPLSGLEAAKTAADDYHVVIRHLSFVVSRLVALSLIVRHYNDQRLMTNN